MTGITETKIKCIGIKKIMEDCGIEFVLVMNHTFNKFEVFSVDPIILEDYDSFENIPNLSKITNIGSYSSKHFDLKDIIKSLTFYRRNYRFMILIERGNILYLSKDNNIETLDFEIYNFEYSCKMIFNNADKLYEYVSRYYKQLCEGIKNIDIDLKLDILKEV